MKTKTLLEAATDMLLNSPEAAIASLTIDMDESINEALKPSKYPLVRKTMEAAKDLDEDELEELFFTLSNYMIYGGFGDMGFNSRLYDEVGAHLFRAAKTWKERYN